MIESKNDPAAYGSSSSAQQQRWGKEINAAQDRLRKFHKTGTRVQRRYRGEDKTDIQDADTNFHLNLFNSNITTLQAMLFGSTPKTEVKRRFSDPDDDVARVASLILQRILQTDIEEPGSDITDILQQSLQDRLLPGLGMARVRYEFQSKVETIEAETDENGLIIFDEYQDEMLVNERAPIEYVYWKDFLWGWARTWAEVPWVAFRAHLTKSQARKRFGRRIARNLQYNREQGSKKDEPRERDQENPWATAEVWEIWCKEDRKVYWFSSGAQRILDMREDPMELPGFFPCPPPMAANLTTEQFMPKADFTLAQDLYNEIDVLSTRITLITRAVKVVGVYDKNNDSVKRMLKEGVENDMIPVDNWAMLGEKGGLKGVTDWFPVGEVAAVLDKLRDLRNEQIQLLFQVTGLSDVMRGSAEQYEAAATSKLKSKFASTRVQAIQDQFAQFASDLMTLKACIIAKHFDPETIMRQSNIMQTADANLAQSAIQLIQSPEEATWRVSIAPESVAMVDYAQLKADRTEFLTALATFLQSGQAVIKVAPGSAEFMLEMLKWGVAGFKGSKEIEGVLDRAMDSAKQAAQQAAQQPKQPSPEQIKAQMAQQKMQMDLQKEMMKHTNEMKKMAAEFRAELQTLRAKLQFEIGKESIQAEAKIAEIQANEKARRSQGNSSD